MPKKGQNIYPHPRRGSIVHFLIGIPGSGKSFFARDLQRRRKKTVIVSSDRIRGRLYGSETRQGDPTEIFDSALIEVREHLAAGRSVIYDATNLERGHRRETLALMRSWAAHRIIGYWFRPPIEVCFRRNARRARAVPMEAMLRMARHMDRWPPLPEEGFDDLVSINGAGGVSRVKDLEVAGSRTTFGRAKRGTAASASRTRAGQKTRTRR